MWSNGPFARPVSSFEAPIPPIGVDPTGGPFFYVAINQAWMPAVIGCLFQLLLQTTWEYPESDPDVLDLAQLQAFNLIQQFQIATNQCPAGSVPIQIAESDYEMSLCEQLRFQDGKLQALCCGEWTDISGQGNNLGLGTPDQPGDGMPQPVAGGCQTYHGKMQANTAWNLPTGVSTGDIITVQNVAGATYDGGYSSWRCWEGDTFFLGACIPGTGGTRSGDPLPTVKHMRLLANIAGTFYDATTPITVPSGVSNAAVNFQVNDDVLTDNGGDLAFDVEVCNNQPTTWTHTWDFAVTTGGFILKNEPGDTPPTWGEWVAGQGWAGTASFDPGSGAHIHAVRIIRDIPTTTVITGGSFTFNVVKGTGFIPGLSNYLELTLAGTSVAQTSHASETQPDGDGQVLAFTPGTYTADQLELRVNDAYYTAGSDGTSLEVSCTLTGNGVDPF